MKAKGDWVIVCRRSIPERIVNHIIIPICVDQEFWEGVVHSVGENNEGEGLVQGDYVLVDNNVVKIKVGSVKAGEMFAVTYDDIICVVEDEDENE